MKQLRVQRLLQLINLLQSSNGLSANELAHELNISRRTLFRDLKLLESAGIPCNYSQKSGFGISPGFFLPPINLRLTEAMGLMILTKHADAHGKQPFTDSTTSAIRKLLALLPQSIRNICHDMLNSISVRPQGIAYVNHDNEYYPIIQHAINQKHIINITYDSIYDHDVIKTSVRPYHLHSAHRSWYMIAYSVMHKQTRMFKLARIRDIKPTVKRFSMKKPFSIDQYLGKAWSMIPEGKIYKIELQFTPKVGRNVSDVRWHHTQKHQMLKDGSCIVTFEVDGLNEITWWLLGYGDQVIVRKPAALRKKLIQVYNSALQRNSSTPRASDTHDQPLPDIQIMKIKQTRQKET